jgi:hypothetical protein
MTCQQDSKTTPRFERATSEKIHVEHRRICGVPNQVLLWVKCQLYLIHMMVVGRHTWVLPRWLSKKDRKVIVRVQRARTGLTKKIDRTSIRHHPYVSSVHQPLNAEQYNQLEHFAAPFSYLLIKETMINDESMVHTEKKQKGCSQKRPILLNRFFVGRLGKNTPQSSQEIRWQAIEVENVSVRTALEHSGVYEPRQSSASRLLRMKGVCWIWLSSISWDSFTTCNAFK